MSIINSLKSFSKKAFNIEPKGSNIDEVLDDMASKVTPGSGGGDSGSGVVVYSMHKATVSIQNPETGEYIDINVFETEETLSEILNEMESNLVYIGVNYYSGETDELWHYNIWCVTSEESGVEGMLTLSNNCLEDSAHGEQVMALGYDSPIMMLIGFAEG